MSTREIITEFVGGVCFMFLLGFFIVFGLAAEPRYPAMHSEAAMTKVMPARADAGWLTQLAEAKYGK